jgi:hypothetical protein
VSIRARDRASDLWQTLFAELPHIVFNLRLQPPKRGRLPPARPFIEMDARKSGLGVAMLNLLALSYPELKQDITASQAPKARD